MHKLPGSPEQYPQSFPMGAEGPPDATLKPRLYVEAVQTVTPWRSPVPGSKPRHVEASPQALAEAMQARTTVMLLYRKALEDGNGWDLAGKLKESLNVALSEDSIFAGRLRRSDDGSHEVRLTDSGVRLVQARAGVRMDQLLAEGEDVARELVYWVDVDAENCQYSPLVFVQLTIFEGEGYSIGLTCSLLLADPFFLSRFLHTWLKIHTSMRFFCTSMFHLGQFRRANTAPMQTLTANLHPHRRRTLFYASEDRQPAVDLLRQPFTLFLNHPSGDLEIESCGEGASPASRRIDDVVNWPELVGLDGVGFENGLRPAHTFCFIDSNSERGISVVMPPAGDVFAGAVAVAGFPPEDYVEGSER